MKCLLFSFLVLFSLNSCNQKQEPKKIPGPTDFINLFSKNMNTNVSCYRIPSIMTAINGDLIVAIDERVPSCGDLKLNDDINIVIRRSLDNGITWTDIKTIIDYPLGGSASDPSMILDETSGEIFMFFNYMNLETEKDIYYLKVISSRDHGKTWSKPKDITSQITKPEWRNDFKFITSGRGIQTSSGDLIHTLVNLENGLHLFKSKDHGKNWELIDSPIEPGDESKVVELIDGSLMINSRVSGAGTRYKHLSTNNDKTWRTSVDSQLVDPACNASLIRYKFKDKDSEQNILLFSNANSKDKRENLTIKYSYDEGQNWSSGKTIYAGPAAYSSLTILKNGDIGLFFEKDDYKENVFTRFSLEWLIGDKTE